MNRNFSAQLEKRTFNFAVELIKYVGQLPNTQEGIILKSQLTKSGSGIGANYKDATRTWDNSDFKKKIGICESEASETVYWLEVIHELKWSEPTTIHSILKESKELLAIFRSLNNNLRD